MTADADEDTYLRDEPEQAVARSALQRLADIDGWVGQVLPGLVAVSFIVVVALAVMAGEGAPFGILVNALCTGRIATDQIARRHAREKPDMPIEEFIQDSGKDLPMGRMGTAEEFANMACFLASGAASYITGTAINVDGGLSPVV